MKKSLINLSCVAGLALPLQAGEVLSTPKEVLPVCGWNWFAGGSVGYLTDVEEAMYTLHLGTEYTCDNHDCSHAIFLEVGYADFDDNIGGPSLDVGDSTFDIDFDIDTNIIPLTLNYKFEKGIAQNLGWYIGAGAGVAFVDSDLDANVNGNTVESESEDDTVFYGHAFTGLVYNFTESFETFLGARYIWMDDPDLNNDFVSDNYGSLDGDVLVELGLRFNF